MPNITRRDWLRVVTTAACGLVRATRGHAFTAAAEPLPVAAVVTEYRNNSHADVILGKILEGYDQQGGPGPALKLVGLYVDQTRTGDLSRALAEKYGFRLATSIDEAITLSTDRLQVAGVLSIGEHGQYPFTPDTQQHMYPRRRFFDGIANCFRRVGQVVPVFNDKHLSYAWEDAKHMYDVAASLKFPLMAGSSLPVTWRRPPLKLPLGCEIESALAVGHGGIESYGFHALETLQCMVERRAGGESGVKSVRVLKGRQIQAALDSGEWSLELLAATLQKMPGSPAADLNRLHEQSAFFQVEYRDGLKGTVAMVTGLAQHFGFAAKLRGAAEPVATWFELQDQKPYGHFGFLVRAMDDMFHNNRPPYPVERTLLTTGILDAAMHSLADGGSRRESPQLDIRYQATDWPFANA